MNPILLHIGSLAIAFWGLAHIIPTKGVVEGFGALSDENRKIITMEWVAEGLTLIFIGALVFIVFRFSGPNDVISPIICKVSSIALLVFAAWSALTGARTSVLPMKLCPIVKTAVAILFWVGSI